MCKVSLDSKWHYDSPSYLTLLSKTLHTAHHQCDCTTHHTLYRDMIYNTFCNLPFYTMCYAPYNLYYTLCITHYTPNISHKSICYTPHITHYITHYMLHYTLNITHYTTCYTLHMTHTPHYTLHVPLLHCHYTSKLLAEHITWHI